MNVVYMHSFVWRYKARKTQSHHYGFYLEGKTGVSSESCPRKGGKAVGFHILESKTKLRCGRK